MAPPLPILPEETVKEETRKRKRKNNRTVKNAQKAKFRKRYSTLKKKAEELETLCDTKVCLVCFGPDDKFHTFPEEKKNVKDAIMEFRKNSNCIKEFDLLSFLEDKKKKLERKKNNAVVRRIENLFASWNDKIQQLSEKELVDFDDYLEKKLQVLIERSTWLELLEFLEKEEEEEDEEEKGEAIQLRDEGESGPSSLNTNNFNVDQQSCNPLLSLGSGIDCSYNEMMSLNDETLAEANCGIIISAWPLGYRDVGSINSNGTNSGSTSLLEVSDSSTGFEIPKNSDLISYNDNNMLRGEINNILLPNNDFPTEFAKTNTSFEIPENFDLEDFNIDFEILENFDLKGYNNNSFPAAEINSNILPDHDVSLEDFNIGFEIPHDVSLEFAQTNTGSNTSFGIPENFDVTGYNCNLFPNNDNLLEYAQISRDFRTLKNSDSMGESNNSFLLDDHAVFSQLSPLHCAVPRSIWQSTYGTKANCYRKFNPSHDGI